jgi:hypothetical protein
LESFAAFPRSSLFSVVYPLHQPPEFARAELVEALLHIARSPLEKDPRTRARPSTGHKMKATARGTNRAVAFTFEEHVPRRAAASQLAHPLGTEAGEETELGITHEALQALQALKALQVLDS